MNLNEEQPDVSQDTSDSAPDTTEKPDLIDLDTVEKFRFGGREWDRKDFQGAYMMQADYTKKTQALAEERRYYDNLTADLEAISKNPALVQQFKQVYPEKFHGYLRYVTKEQEKVSGNQQFQLPREYEEKFAKVDQLEKMLMDKEVAAIEAKLDAQFSELSKKYPMADEEAVVARAQSLLDKGQKLDDATWDKLWKSVHDVNQKKFETHYKAQVTKQKEASHKAKDVSSGGGIPGQAPKRVSFKEATENAIRDLTGR